MIGIFEELNFCVRTFGCQMNEHDSQRISGLLESLGATQVDEIEESDLVIYVTCCVREGAETRLLGQISSIKNIPRREDAPFGRRYIALGGCIGQRDDSALFESLEHLDIVFGTMNIDELPELVTQAIEGDIQIARTKDHAEVHPTSLPSKRDDMWRAWLPVTSGCDNFCTYCIVPYVRGRERSRTLEDIEQEARRLVAEGAKEITLLGQNVNSYGRDLYGKPRFADVLDAVDATGVQRLRFVTSHPKDLSDDVIAKFAELSSLCPSLHLPFQSGSDAILERMNRKYTRKHYLKLIDKLKAVCPHIALSTDVIVGFPGETEEDFEQTYSLVEEVGYSQVFTFIFSPRKGTPAAEMPDDTPKEIVQKRFDRLVDLVQKKAHEFNQLDLGRTLDVLVEGPSKRSDSFLSGKSERNQTVHAPIPDGTDIDQLRGRIVPVKIEEARTWYLSGKVADK